MSIITRTADLFYTFRFLKILTTPFEKTDAYKLGIIDIKGKRDKNVLVDDDKKKKSYTAFHRLVFNVKRLMATVGAGGKIASYTAPDLTGIEQELAVIEETLISVSESVELARDYTRTIKNDLKDDIARQETLMERLEDKVNSSQDEIDETIDTAEERFDARRDALYSDTDRKIKELEERLNARLQRALDNPLAN